MCNSSAGHSSAATVYVNGRAVKSTNLDFEDLLYLTSEFIKKHGRMPSITEYAAKNNLPQPRILKKILHMFGVSYIEYCGYFGRCNHVRADINEYGLYVDRFRRLCRERGSVILSNELCSKTNLLPSAKWLIKNCPDDSVTTYTEFVRWCGFKERKHTFTKEEVSNRLIRLEKELGRPIVKSDISTPKVGFSLIAVIRLYGGWANAKREIGMADTPPTQPKPADTYIESLKTIVQRYVCETGAKCITWFDIESGQYGASYCHKTYAYAFKRAGLDIKKFIQRLGCDMVDNYLSVRHTYPDGEVADSSFESRLSDYLRKTGFVYNHDYYRNVQYRKFCKDMDDPKSRIDCDYIINIDGNTLYVEVAGLIGKRSGNWRTHDYQRGIMIRYRDKLVRKAQLLRKNNLLYIFIFPEDFYNDRYVSQINQYIDRIRDINKNERILC